MGIMHPFRRSKSPIIISLTFNNKLTLRRMHDVTVVYIFHKLKTRSYSTSALLLEDLEVKIASIFLPSLYP